MLVKAIIVMNASFRLPENYISILTTLDAFGGKMASMELMEKLKIGDSDLLIYLTHLNSKRMIKASYEIGMSSMSKQDFEIELDDRGKKYIKELKL